MTLRHLTQSRAGKGGTEKGGGANTEQVAMARLICTVMNGLVRMSRVPESLRLPRCSTHDLIKRWDIEVQKPLAEGDGAHESGQNHYVLCQVRFQLPAPKLLQDIVIQLTYLSKVKA